MIAINTDIMNLDQSMNAATQKAFPFLELPCELRNMIYKLVGENATAGAVIPIIKRPQAPGIGQTEAKAFALLRTCKQIRGEIFFYIHSAIHGTIHWSRHYGYMEARIPWGLAFKRTKAATEIAHAVQHHGHMLQHIRHLDLYGSGAASLVLDLVDYDEWKLDGSILNETRAELKRQCLQNMRLLMQNVGTLTLHADREEMNVFLRHAIGFQGRSRKLLTAFPNLRKICMGTPNGVKIVAKRDVLKSDGDIATWRYCPSRSG